MSLDLSAPSKESLTAESRSWAEKAADLRIVDKESCVHASHFLRSIKGLRADIQRFFAPHLEAAMETKRKAEAARKGLADEQARIESPLIAAEGVVKRALLAWEDVQEQARQAEERRLQAEAQQRAEAATVAVAAQLEIDAHLQGDAVMLQEAHDILEQPIEAPAVSVATFLPKVQGVTYRDNWKAHPEVNVRVLAKAVAEGTAPATLLLPNMTALNQMAKATQGTTSVPGVKFYNDRQIAARG